MISLPAYIVMGLIAFLCITALVGIVIFIHELINFNKLEKDCEDEK